MAEGDVCPISLLPMEDINPTFVPRTLRPLRMNAATPMREPAGKGKGKGKAVAVVENPKSNNLLTFFSVYLILLLSIFFWVVAC